MLAPRATASLAGFRDLLVQLTADASHDSVSVTLGKVLDQSGYLKDLRDEHSEDAENRIENLVELVSAAREAGFADVIAALCSGDGSWINGQTVFANGGIV